MLRDVADSDGFFEVSCETGVTASGLKRVLMEGLGRSHPEFDAEQVWDCALATETEIIGDERRLDPCAHLAILPPVCGG